MENTDSYKTLSAPSEEILFKEKKSKFFGYAYPIKSEDEVKPLIEKLKKQHHTANHVCYAWQLGINNAHYRANDDGEPNNSAGMPIYGQIQSFGVTNVLVAVARIFGGTKLGVGGLISAYKTAAQMALEVSPIVTRIQKAHFKVHFGYESMDKVMRIIKQNNLDIVSQKLEMECDLEITSPKSHTEMVMQLFKENHMVSIQLKED
ncbi:YigZ family protein [Maribacter sp. TH_r10]|uniref:YigZ family protein n=1 Tax=Maribacter luteus TaxID=2594478 RepID=A0A6I2MU33_9FLAO|nr:MULTISPECIES: YigZ family protein [Maribacter]MDV7138598.1 YigZ family protein [Maribacter sp. TH_r10]MRX66030.1 YigZ family protein [Maribacter luteus]|tara:strand:- start:1183 stop:1797 length:615 start_codon:yes stop_codon:yes gene_type:complete